MVIRDYMAHYTDEDGIEAQYLFPAGSIEEARVMADELSGEPLMDVEPYDWEPFEEDEL